MFGGPNPQNADPPCMPWDFLCALKDYYVLNPIPEDLVNYPLLNRMRAKTTLTKIESDKLDEVI